MINVEKMNFIQGDKKLTFEPMDDLTPKEVSEVMIMILYGISSASTGDEVDYLGHIETSGMTRHFKVSTMETPPEPKDDL
jgi:hypothetical protein